MKLQQHLNQYIYIYLQRECHKISLLIVLLWLLKIIFDQWFFYFSVHGDRQRIYSTALVWRSVVKPIKVLFKYKNHWAFLHFFFFLFEKQEQVSQFFLLVTWIVWFRYSILLRNGIIHLCYRCGINVMFVTECTF